MRFFIGLLLTAVDALVLHAQVVPLDDPSRLELKGVHVQTAPHQGLAALKVTELNNQADTGAGLAVIKDLTFHNGAIEVDVSGAPAQGAEAQARGFIGIAFRISSRSQRFEEFYIRPTNARAEDQLRRNHSTQYVSSPDWTWERLRKESPGVYESYADMAAGEWTHLRITVQGTHALLFVNGATHPCLIVNDLKNGDSEGGIALWIGPGTEGYFRNLSIKSSGEAAAR